MRAAHGARPMAHGPWRAPPISQGLPILITIQRDIAHTVGIAAVLLLVFFIIITTLLNCLK
jgi:hypothetical protein